MSIVINNPRVEETLNEISLLTGQSIEECLNHILEDYLDYLNISNVILRKVSTISLEDLEKQLGLEN